MQKTGPEASPRELMAAFAQLMELRAAGPDRFSVAPAPRGNTRIYGGQVIAQALRAAELTVEGRAPHSLHAYFLRPGDETRAIDYLVDRNMDGRSISSRRVVAIQGEKTLFTMAVSFHVGRSGFEHSAPFPDVQMPEDLPDEVDVIARLRQLDRHDTLAGLPFLPFESRLPETARILDRRRDGEPYYLWFRAPAPLGDDLRDHRCLLSYVSDWGLLSAMGIAHRKSFYNNEAIGTSLDHALWLHEPDTRMDDWILFICGSPWAGHGRGLNSGRFFTRDGRHIATVMQEGLGHLA